jgi:hypothetical protein
MFDTIADVIIIAGCIFLAILGIAFISDFISQRRRDRIEKGIDAERRRALDRADKRMKEMEEEIKRMKEKE